MNLTIKEKAKLIFKPSFKINEINLIDWLKKEIEISDKENWEEKNLFFFLNYSFVDDEICFTISWLELIANDLYLNDRLESLKFICDFINNRAIFINDKIFDSIIELEILLKKHSKELLTKLIEDCDQTYYLELNDLEKLFTLPEFKIKLNTINF